MSDKLSIPDTVLAALEALINRYLALDPERAARLGDLQGRVICIELTGFGTRFYLIPGAARIQLYADYGGAPDCVLSGTPLALARMGISHRKEDQLFSGSVRIEGDTHLAQAFGELAGSLEVDWEEQLSRVAGDLVAHQIGSKVRAVGRWGRHAGETLTQDFKEYLQEEARLLPDRYEVQGFLGEVDRLRDDVERLAARVERLAKFRDTTTVGRN